MTSYIPLEASRLTRLWLDVPQVKPASRLRLFCFPYAGGGVHVYRAWPDYFQQDVELLFIQMPGRGARIKEPSPRSMGEWVHNLYEAIVPELDRPFAFFGHSLGSLVCFELARALRSRRQPGPSHLFVSGRRAPQMPIVDRRLYELPNAQLLLELKRLKGTPLELLNNVELMHLVLPPVRADFEVHGTYRYVAGPALDCPITAFGGQSDPAVTEEQLRAWRAQTIAPFTSSMLPGGHFFINESRSLLLEQINQCLSTMLGAELRQDPVMEAVAGYQKQSAVASSSFL